MRLFVLCRHGQSTFNVQRRVNGDPGVAVPLTDQGVANALLLGTQLEALPLDLCVHSGFERTRRTAAVALGRRDVPLLEEPLLGDVRVGELDGATIEDYRAWKQGRARSEPFPGGESLDDAGRRFAVAFERLLARPERAVLVVCHEIPVRYALNAAAGSPTLDGPVHDIGNAAPYLFDDAALARAAARIRRLVGAAAD